MQVKLFPVMLESCWRFWWFPWSVGLSALVLYLLHSPPLNPFPGTASRGTSDLLSFTRSLQVPICCFIPISPSGAALPSEDSEGLLSVRRKCFQTCLCLAEGHSAFLLLGRQGLGWPSPFVPLTSASLAATYCLKSVWKNRY